MYLYSKILGNIIVKVSFKVKSSKVLDVMA